jgi:hypothetical protein
MAGRAPRRGAPPDRVCRRAAEPDPLDTALYAADLADEPAWLAELAAFGPDIAANIARQQGHDKGCVRFPCNPSQIRETRFLLAREPRLVVQEAQHSHAVAAAVRDIPGWMETIGARHLERLDQRLPLAAAAGGSAIRDLLCGAGPGTRASGGG